MIILSVETSCDETAVSIVEAKGGLESPTFVILGNTLLSQIDIHKEYGGVFPMLAKREHARNLTPLLLKTLKQAELYKSNSSRSNFENVWQEIEIILSREEGLYTSMRNALENIQKPKIDVIGVTSGPGLEPALWVGISFAEALAKLWNIPVIGINHMEGHMASVLLKTDARIMNDELRIVNNSIQFPALALLISGGHTELVDITNWGEYKVIGETLDDAVGEAFDKVARMLELPYPGGPEIGKLAEYAREQKIPHKAKLPRPMIHSHNLNFSFSGLKTAVLYYIRDYGPLSPDQKADLAREFEDVVVDVLLSKTKEALEETGAKTLIIAGGVIANKKLKEVFLALEESKKDLVIKIPTKDLATDNALMIAYATYINVILYPEMIKTSEKIIARGNVKLGKRGLK